MLKTAVGLLFLTLMAHSTLFDRSGKIISSGEIEYSQVAWERLPFSSRHPMNGIGRIAVTFDYMCTGFLIETRGAANRPAYVLTNGHCAVAELSTFKTHPTLVDQPPPPGMDIKLNDFFDAGERERNFRVRRVTYATEAGIDLAVLELGVSVEELKRNGFHFYRIESHVPQSGEKVKAVGVPFVGVDDDHCFLHSSECELVTSSVVGFDASGEMGSRQWTGLYEHKCSTVGGQSGSPMFSKQSGNVVAIVNAEDERINYSMHVDMIPGCFNSQGRFDLSLLTCRLPKP